MLVIRGIAPFEDVIIETGEIFKLYWKYQDFESSIVRWQTSNNPKSLLSFRIDGETYRIVSLGLVLSDNAKIGNSSYQNLNNTPMILFGSPIFNINFNKDQTVINDKEPFKIFYTDRALTIELGDYTDLEQIIRSKNVEFGIDKSGIVRIIRVSNLNTAQENYVLKWVLKL